MSTGPNKWITHLIAAAVGGAAGFIIPQGEKSELGKQVADLINHHIQLRCPAPLHEQVSTQAVFVGERLAVASPRGVAPSIRRDALNKIVSPLRV